MASFNNYVVHKVGDGLKTVLEGTMELARTFDVCFSGHFLYAAILKQLWQTPEHLTGRIFVSEGT